MNPVIQSAATAALALAVVCPGADAAILDDQPKTLVVNGYSTSIQWPILLQQKLDDHYGVANPGERVITVERAILPGNPLANWVDVQTGQPKQPWLDILRPALQAPAGPVILLAQQTLQGVYSTDRTIGIDGPDDTARIEQGADALQTYAELALADGADQVIIATHIYKVTQEPQIENEKHALDLLMQRGLAGIERGPDVWSATEPLFPVGFQADQVHPNAIGAEAMAQAWFDHLVALSVPEPGAAVMAALATLLAAPFRGRRG